MAFNKCTIGGKSYGEVIDPRTGEAVEHVEVCAQFLHFFENFGDLMEFVCTVLWFLKQASVLMMQIQYVFFIVLFMNCL